MTVETSIAYSTDGYNGLFDYCRTNGVTLTATASSVYQAGYEADHAVDGIGTSLTFTKNIENSWVAVELPAHYLLDLSYINIQGRTDYHTDHLRNYRLEGSNDGSTWTEIWDSGGNGPGQSTWYGAAVTPSEPYRWIRIFQYGAASSGNNYLTLSEFEVYGDLVYDDTLPGQRWGLPLWLTLWTDSETISFSTLGHNGLLNYMRDNSLDFTTSEIDSYLEAYPMSNATDDEDLATIFHSASQGAGVWGKIDLGSVRMVPSHFGVTRGSGTHSLDAFKIQGSNDDSTWDDLATVTSGPSSLNEWYGQSITTSTEYRYLRIILTGGPYLVIGSIEFWGTLIYPATYNPANPPLSLSPYRDEVLADSPVAYYRLGESSGTTMVDSSGNSRDGVHTAHPPVLGVTGLIAGDADTCADYQSGTDYSRVDDAAWMDFAGDFSVEVWVNLDARQNKEIAARWSSVDATKQWILGFDYTNDVRFVVRVGGTNYEAATGDSGATVTTGATFHIVGTYDATSGDVLLYVDGTQIASANSGGGAMSASDQRITVGCRWNGSYTRGTKGRIDEVAIYDTALSSTRIQAHYNAGIA